MFCIFCIFCIYWMNIVLIHKENSMTFIVYCNYCFVPIPGPSCLRTTTYNHHHCSLICCSKLWESQPIPYAWQKVLFPSLQLEQEEGVPVWRTLESHTRLVLFHGVCRLLQIDTDPAMLRLQQIIQNIHILHIMHKLVWYIWNCCTWSGLRIPWTLILLLSSGIAGKPKEVYDVLWYSYRKRAILSGSVQRTAYLPISPALPCSIISHLNAW
jgi:hypothetical protein